MTIDHYSKSKIFFAVFLILQFWMIKLKPKQRLMCDAYNKWEIAWKVFSIPLSFSKSAIFNMYWYRRLSSADCFLISCLQSVIWLSVALFSGSSSSAWNKWMCAIDAHLSSIYLLIFWNLNSILTMLPFQTPSMPLLDHWCSKVRSHVDKDLLHSLGQFPEQFQPSLRFKRLYMKIKVRNHFIENQASDVHVFWTHRLFSLIIILLLQMAQCHIQEYGYFKSMWFVKQF